jgi:hypothetical protein
MDGNIVSDHDHEFNSSPTDPAKVDEEPISVDTLLPSKLDGVNILVEKGLIAEEKSSYLLDGHSRQYLV